MSDWTGKNETSRVLDRWHRSAVTEFSSTFFKYPVWNTVRSSGCFCNTRQNNCDFIRRILYITCLSTCSIKLANVIIHFSQNVIFIICWISCYSGKVIINFIMSATVKWFILFPQLSVLFSNAHNCLVFDVVAFSINFFLQSAINLFTFKPRAAPFSVNPLRMTVFHLRKYRVIFNCRCNKRWIFWLNTNCTTWNVFFHKIIHNSIKLCKSSIDIHSFMLSS